MNQAYGYFGSLGDVTVVSLQTAWYKLLQYLPQIIGAIIILIIGWIVASFIGGVVQRILYWTGVDSYADRLGVNQRFGLSPKYKIISGMLGAVVKWFLVVVTLVAAVNVLNLQQVNIFLNSVLLYIPNVIAAVIILTTGLLIAEGIGSFVGKSLQASRLPVDRRDLVGKIARYAIIVFTVLAVLTQLNIVPQLVQILFGGLMLALALAFGLGGRDEAARWLATFRRDHR